MLVEDVNRSKGQMLACRVNSAIGVLNGIKTNLDDFGITDFESGTQIFERGLKSIDQRLVFLEDDLRSKKEPTVDLLSTKVELLIRAVALGAAARISNGENPENLLSKIELSTDSAPLLLSARAELLAGIYDVNPKEQIMDAEVLFGVLRELRGGQFDGGAEEGLLEQIIGGSNLERVRRAVQDKTLWVVPNWECNRGNKPCEICFATDIMADAKAKGYQSASPDFFAKLMLLSQLPFKEVVIPGGEPTQDLELLRTTLASIDPQRRIRIITNGDWALRKTAKKGIPSREEVLSVIFASERQVRVEISSHDSEDVFKRKLKVLKGKVELGAQLRKEEGLDYGNAGLRDFIRDEKMFLEDHHVLAIGKTKGRPLSNGYNPVPIDLKKLAEYTNKKNMGIYLIAGDGGARVIANHEAPYLVYPTPADLVDSSDTAPDVLKKIVDYFIDRNADVDDIGFAAAAFKVGQPIINLDVTRPRLHFHTSDYLKECNRVKERAKRIMDGYYNVIAERSNLSIQDLKKVVADAIAARIAEVATKDVHYWIPDDPVVKGLAYFIPNDSSSLALKIARDMIAVSGASAYRRYDRSQDPYADFLHYCLGKDDKAKLLEHLEVCGLSLEGVQI